MRRWLGPGVLGFIALEIFLMIAVGRRFGGGPTFLALVAGAIAGGWIIRHEAKRALAAMQAVALEGAPAERAGASALGVVAGVSLLIPGFASDALAVLLLVPPVRRALEGRVQLAFAQRAPAAGLRGFGPFAPPQPPGGSRIVDLDPSAVRDADDQRDR